MTYPISGPSDQGEAARSEKVELLPCPFCGERKININARSCTGIPRYWQAECEECGATSHGSYHLDRDGAIKEWNIRASHPRDADLSGLVKQALSAAAGIDLLQDSMSLRRRTAEILNELVAALRQSSAAHSGERAGVAWQYQRKEGWGDIWRTTDVDPYTPGFFDTPEDWRIRSLYASPPPVTEAAGSQPTMKAVEEELEQLKLGIAAVAFALGWTDLKGVSLEQFARDTRAQLASARKALETARGVIAQVVPVDAIAFDCELREIDAVLEKQVS